MTDDRRLAVLRAIVQDFVASEEPVGSKALVDRHDLGVSSATIRNDMAALEDEGYIAQPHTSAGRIPTDKGYRLFVDRLANLQPLSPAERRAIQSFLDGAVDLDDVVERGTRLLSQLTRQVAIVQYPSLGLSRVRHIELVSLSSHRVLLILIADTGRVEQRVIEFPTAVAAEMLADLRTQLNTVLAEQPFEDIDELVTGLDRKFPTAERALVTRLLSAVGEAAGGQVEERVVVAGAANLARYDRDFPQTVHPVLEALEEQVVLLRLLGEATAVEQVHVRIGRENDVADMTTTSVVTSGYGPGDRALAHLGVVGPTRMDYPTSMTAVRAVARYLGRILSEQ
ncbi:MAG: heat-inducible transcriptional repressor HrcA [Micrococcales bacterium]|nr:heat-inducible transcriptional repressor HrcA [Micrococcales bacterium]